MISGARTAIVLFQAYVEFMKLMLGNLFLLTGGSATALIAFLGTRTNTATTSINFNDALLAIQYFALAAFLSVAAMGCVAFQENLNSSWLEAGKQLGLKAEAGWSWWQLRTFLLGLIGWVLMLCSGYNFAAGCYAATGKELSIGPLSWFG